MPDPVHLGNSTPQYQPIDSPKSNDQNISRSDSISDSASEFSRLGKAKMSPFLAVKRFFSSILQGIIYLGEKIGSLFSSARKGDDPISRLEEIRNSKAEISNEAIDSGQVKVPTSPDKQFNNDLYNALVNHKFDKIPAEYFNILKSLDDIGPKISSNHTPLLSPELSKSRNALCSSLMNLVEKSQEKITPEVFGKIAKDATLMSIMRADKDLENFIIQENGGQIKSNSGTPASWTYRTFAGIEKDALNGDQKAAEFLESYRNIKNKDDYDKVITTFKEQFLKTQIELQKKLADLKENSLDELKNKLKEVFGNVNIEISKMELEFENQISKIHTPADYEAKKESIAKISDNFVKERKTAYDELSSLLTDKSIKESLINDLFKQKKPLLAGEYKALYNIADSFKNDKAVQDLVNLVKSNKVPDGKTVYDTVTALTNKILPNILDAKFSNWQDTEGLAADISFVLYFLVQEYPELKEASKFTEILDSHHATIDRKDRVHFQNSLGCLAFDSVFHNNKP